MIYLNFIQHFLFKYDKYCNLREYLQENGVDRQQIISINFEDVDFEFLTNYKKLHAYVSERLVPGKMTYVFLDEIQNVPEFQKAVDSLFIKDHVDVYITGSNATLLSGRYIEIGMLPLSFKEFYELKGGNKRDTFTEYYRAGAFPYAASITDPEIRNDYLRGIYSTVLLKDIVARKRIGDVPLLESIIKFLFSHIGNIVSSKKIADSLTPYGRKTTSVTVESYIDALMKAFILYKADRYDVRGKQYLKSLEKYYLVDIGFRHLLLGERNTDVGPILENIVYLELLRRGYTVHIGKVGDKEVDFIAQSGDDKIYYQVAASIMDPVTFEREFSSLKKINDHYPKFVLTMDDIPMGDSGIKQVNIIDFLLEN